MTDQLANLEEQRKINDISGIGTAALFKEIIYKSVQRPVRLLTCRSRTLILNLSRQK